MNPQTVAVLVTPEPYIRLVMAHTVNPQSTSWRFKNPDNRLLGEYTARY